MRFSDGDEEYPGQWWLWEQALFRAVNGRRGQQILRELEQALLALPEKQLIEGRLSDGKGVCAVGAYVTHKRVEAGEPRDEVLAMLKRRAELADGDLDGWQAEEETILQAEATGMQLTLAVSVASLNDEYYPVTPEQRYERVLEWVQKRIIPEEVAA